MAKFLIGWVERKGQAEGKEQAGLHLIRYCSPFFYFWSFSITPKPDPSHNQSSLIDDVDEKNINSLFWHKGKCITAECSVIKPQAYELFRVVLQKESRQGEIFVFYKTEKVDGEPFFWFQLPERKNQIAVSIAKQLIKTLIK